MVELIIFSVIVGVFAKGWLAKLCVFPGILALYATLRFYFSPKAKIIRANRVLDGRGLGLGSYAAIFAYRAFLSAVVAGVVGFIVRVNYTDLVGSNLKAVIEKPTLTPEEDENLRNFAEAIHERQLAVRVFNQAMGSGTVVVTLPKEVVDDLIQKNKWALELSKRTRSEVLSKVHPELDQMVREHFEKQLELYLESLKTGSISADLKAQRHEKVFADWWDSNRNDMPIVKRAMKRVVDRKSN